MENKDQASNEVKEDVATKEAAPQSEQTEGTTSEEGNEAPAAEKESIQFDGQNVVAPALNYPAFKAGDTITVHYKIIEGNKQRIQAFRGDVIQKKGSGITQTFTVRKVSNGIGVERIFPIHSPNIDKIEVNKKGYVRRAKIYYLRELKGKKARIKEKRS